MLFFINPYWSPAFRSSFQTLLRGSTIRPSMDPADSFSQGLFCLYWEWKRRVRPISVRPINLGILSLQPSSSQSKPLFDGLQCASQSASLQHAGLQFASQPASLQSATHLSALDPEPQLPVFQPHFYPMSSDGGLINFFTTHSMKRIQPWQNT